MCTRFKCGTLENGEMYHLIVQKLTYQTWAHCHQKEGGDLNRRHPTKNNASIVY